MPHAAGQSMLVLHPVDLSIIALYFVLVLGIGFYVKRFAKTGEGFFMAGRGMTAWIAGLAFISTNLGSQETMGYSGTTYQYGMVINHAYWIGAIPAILFLSLVMMPFYHICRTHSVPGYLKLRFGEASRGLAGISFAVLTIFMSGINMFGMATTMHVILGWNLHFSIWVASLTVAIYVSAGGLLSAIFNEVLQFFLIWLGCLVIPILGLIETGGWDGMVARIAQRFPGNYTHMWSCMGSAADNPVGIHWAAIIAQVVGMYAAISALYVNPTYYFRVPRWMNEVTDHTQDAYHYGGDFSVFLGMGVAALVYLVLAVRTVRTEAEAQQQLLTEEGLLAG